MGVTEKTCNGEYSSGSLLASGLFRLITNNLESEMSNEVPRFVDDTHFFKMTSIASWRDPEGYNLFHLGIQGSKHNTLVLQTQEWFQ